MEKEQQTPHILIAGVHGFLGKYILREFVETYSRKSIVTLGLNVDNDIVCDLTKEIPSIPYDIDTVIDAVGDCFGNNLRLQNVATTRRLLEALEKNPPRRFVYFSTTEVFGMEEGENIDESTAKNPRSDIGRIKLEVEKILSEWCERNNVTLSIIYCPPIIGTGMKGYPRTLVNSIYRGFYTHIDGNEARGSVVHATDVARASRLVSEIGGEYIITDGVNPTRHDLAEALAYRLDDKRIFTISLSKAKRTARLIDLFTMSNKRRNALRLETTTLTFSCEKLRKTTGFEPQSVTEYLRTHIYDENSL